MGAIVDPDADVRERDEERRRELWAHNQRAMFEAKKTRAGLLAGDAAALNNLGEAWEPVVEAGYTVEGVTLDSYDWRFPVQGN